MDTPCSGWTPDLSCCPEWGAVLPEDIQGKAITYATTVLWAATGRRFGLCNVVVRPCGRDIGNIPSIAGYMWSAMNGTWFPFIDSIGAWNNCSCPTGCCSCRPRCEALLPGPVNSVTSVTVDGVTIDPAFYRVDNRRWLVRTDGQCWPDCQDFNVDSGIGTFIVSYVRGRPVPSALQIAAGTLACEFAKACAGVECRLPGRIRSIARAGVDVVMVDPETLLNHSLTGIPEVDQIIMTFNPTGLVNRSLIWSPDQRLPRVVTTP